MDNTTQSTQMFPSFLRKFDFFKQKALALHSTHDVDRLSFDSIADVLHVDDWTQQVHLEPQVLKVPLAEQFHMGGQEVLRKIWAQRNKFSHFRFLTVQEKKLSSLLESTGGRADTV